MLFNKSKKIIDDHNYELYLNDDKIKSVNSTKFLGLVIDNKLEWKEHIHICRNKIASGIYAMNSSKNTLSTALLKTVYNSLIQPYLTYGLLLWGSTYTSYTHVIAIMQKKQSELWPKSNTMITRYLCLNNLKFYSFLIYFICNWIYSCITTMFVGFLLHWTLFLPGIPMCILTKLDIVKILT
jgi:hypothetical protein